MYDFKQQLLQGARGEQDLDLFFAQWYVVQPVTMAQQRQGIDRIFRRKCDGREYRVEYKTDWTASKTGNAFVETVSVDTTGKAGWAVTSQADVLIYYLPEDLLIYVFNFRSLRTLLAYWRKHYPTRRIPNNGYHTHGLLVPLHEFERHALQVISI